VRTFENITVEVKEDKAIITVDLCKDVGSTKSGKAVMVGTTRGWQNIYNDVASDGSVAQYSLNVNVVKRVVAGAG